MKFLTVPAVIAAAVFSAVVTVPFVDAPAHRSAGNFALEASMTSTRPGVVQVYYSDQYGAWSETASSRQPLVQSRTPRVYRLPLPAGRFGELRFDPLSRAGAVVIESLRIVDRGGREVRTIPFSDVTSRHQIEAMHERDVGLEVTTTPDANDPQVTIRLAPALEVPGSFRDRFTGFRSIALSAFGMLIAFLLGLERLPRMRSGLASVARALSLRPGRAISFVAAIAVIASAYPVVFMGKSHVSPNFGTPLLYEGVPTLPDSANFVTVNPRGADVGAMMWAHLPYSVVEHRAIAGGELPLWNRYNALGTPLLGQGQSMLGDPLHLPVILCNGAAWAWDAKFLIAKWLFAFGLGLLVFGITRHLPAALIVVVAAPFIGFFVYRINHAAYFSLCYAPWPLYCWLRLTQAADRRGVAGWGAGMLVANLALMNSGTVKEAYLLLLAMNFSGACVLLLSAVPLRIRLLKLCVCAWVGVLLGLLTAPVWATFLHTLRHAQSNYELAAAYQIQPALLLGAFDEAFFRLITPGELVFNPSINFLLLLGLLYFLATLRLHGTDRAALALGASALVPFALVFGIVPASWITAVPLLGRVQHIDNTFLCALIVLWSVLAGVGFSRAATRLGTPDGRSDLMKMAWWLFAIVGMWIAFRQTVHRGAFGPGMAFSVLQHGQVLAVSGFVWGYLVTLLGASAALALLAHRSLRLRRLTPSAGLLGALCVVLLLWRHGLHAGVVRFEDHVVRPPARVDLQATSAAMEYVRTAQAREPGRGFGLHDNFFMGWTGVYGLEAINGPDALMNPWFRELIAVSGATPGISWDFSVPPENLADVRPFFDALNVRFYFSRGSDEAVLRASLTPRQVLDLDIWESRTVWPRAFFTDRVAVYDDAPDLVRKIRSGDGRPFAAVQRSDQSTLAGLGTSVVERTVGAATNYRLTENTTAFDVHASGAGAIVLSETFWPGDFRAEVNGRKSAVLRFNHAFKGVAVSAAGDYHVVFRYVPKNFPRNLLLCATGAVLLTLSLVLGLRGRVTTPPVRD